MFSNWYFCVKAFWGSADVLNKMLQRPRHQWRDKSFLDSSTVTQRQPWWNIQHGKQQPWLRLHPWSCCFWVNEEIILSLVLISDTFSSVTQPWGSGPDLRPGSMLYCITPFFNQSYWESFTWQLSSFTVYRSPRALGLLSVYTNLQSPQHATSMGSLGAFNPCLQKLATKYFVYFLSWASSTQSSCGTINSGSVTCLDSSDSQDHVRPEYGGYNEHSLLVCMKAFQLCM